MSNSAFTIGTPAGLSYKNIVISTNSSGTFTTASATLVAVTNLTCTITTTGGPVLLCMQSGSTANTSYMGNPTANVASSLAYFRDAVQLSLDQLSFGTSGYPNIGCCQFIDTPVAGTYTYTIRASAGGGTFDIQYAKLVAMEL
jgi:hypothetical protein